MSTESDDDTDEEIQYQLLYPFVCCVSNGGPYDDDAFTAGYAMGRLDECLKAAQNAGAMLVTYTIRTELVRQAELIAMHYNFPVMMFRPVADYPEWGEVSFARSEYKDVVGE